MKIKEGFVIRKVGKDYVVMNTNEDSLSFNGMLSLNQVGAFIYNILASKDVTIDDIVKELVKEYEVKDEIAYKDVTSFVKVLKENNLIDE